MGIDALIPFKALDQAKSRLAGALQPADRRELARWMGARVVEALRESGVVDRIGLVGADPVLAGRWRGDPQVVTIRATGLSLNRDLETGGAGRSAKAPMRCWWRWAIYRCSLAPLCARWSRWLERRRMRRPS